MSLQIENRLKRGRTVFHIIPPGKTSNNTYTTCCYIFSSFYSCCVVKTIKKIIFTTFRKRTFAILRLYIYIHIYSASSYPHISILNCPESIFYMLTLFLSLCISHIIDIFTVLVSLMFI